MIAMQDAFMSTIVAMYVRSTQVVVQCWLAPFVSDTEILFCQASAFTAGEKLQHGQEFRRTHQAKCGLWQIT